MTTVREVFLALVRRPGELLVRQWNWKSALYSSLCRASLFLAVNLTSGWRAALGAMTAEFIYRVLSAGFYGSLTQAFRRVEPRWQATVATVTLLVAVSHTIEFLVHWARGTPNLLASIGASMAFTCLSTLFNLYAMRNGVFITGQDSNSLLTDFRLLPGIVAGFLSQLPRSFRHEH
jgi:hypothetical protein